MKKVLLSLMLFMGLIMFMPVSASEKVPVYMFSKEGCSACIKANEYFSDLEEEYPDLFELIEVIVFNGQGQQISEERTTLAIKVYEHFDEDTSRFSTPTIVIGDYHNLGLPADTSEVYDAIVDAKESKEKVDVIKSLMDDLDIELDDLIEAEEMPQDEGGKYDTLIIVGVFVVLIGGFAAIFVFSKK